MAFVSTFGGAPVRAQPAPPARPRTRPSQRAAPTAMFGLGRALRAREAAARLRLWRAIDASRRAEECAARSEDFRAAARHRDRATRLRARDPYVRVRTRLDEAVAAERFLQAARLRDALARLEPPPVVLADADADFGAWRVRARWAGATSVVTRDVEVEVAAEFDAARSGMQRGALAVFRASLTVVNRGDDYVQIVGRRWRIDEFASGHAKQVEGCGVGARRMQPVLAPGDSFACDTAVPVAVLGLAPVPIFAGAGATEEEAEVERVDGGRGIAVGAFAGVLEFVSGDLGECAWDASVGETLLMLPT